MNFRKIILTIIVCMTYGFVSASDFISVKGNNFLKNGTPYYYIGTNFWYGPILGSEGEGGNRERLCAELDNLHSLGLDNLRILVGADAGSANANTVKPYLQQDGMLNDTLLAGLDYMLMEMAKRDMSAVIYLTNSWDWSGGYGYYLKQTGHGDTPNAAGEGYNDYVKFCSAFVLDTAALNLYYKHVERIVTRTNRYTGKLYRDDPTIMSWQICNEPRPFSKEGKPAFGKWISETAALIKRLDNHHLVSTGSEGLYGCEVDAALCEQIHNDPNVDYLTIHIWPVNWRWASPDRLMESLPNAFVKTNEYIALHERMAQKMVKPMVIEEFGYSRNRTFYQPGTSVSCRDTYYDFIFGKVVDSYRNNGILAGCNFWGWGGAGRPADKEWKAGNDYLCDPPHEPQGWYSVYDSDSTTIDIIRKHTQALLHK